MEWLILGSLYRIIDRRAFPVSDVSNQMFRWESADCMGFRLVAPVGWLVGPAARDLLLNAQLKKVSVVARLFLRLILSLSLYLYAKQLIFSWKSWHRKNCDIRPLLMALSLSGYNWHSGWHLLYIRRIITEQRLSSSSWSPRRPWQANATMPIGTFS